MNKPEKVITVVRTGYGDNGTTWFNGNKQFPKTDLNIEYIGLLDWIQSYSADMYSIQDLVFALGANHHSPTSQKYIDLINLSAAQFEAVIKAEAPRLNPLTGFIRTTKKNAKLMQLRCIIRHTELVACKLKETNPNMDLHIRALNILSDYVFVCAWAVTRRHNVRFEWAGDPQQNTPYDDFTSQLLK
jgi:cob(I)alamin adenosyltransferase